jgi:phosphonate transport system permease protein
VRATGASRVEEIVWGVLPQVAPLWTSFALYRFEANARSATVLGLIGAGGIGALLVETMNAFAFDQTSAIVLVIIVAVSAIDFLSQLIRGACSRLSQFLSRADGRRTPCAANSPSLALWRF